MGKKSLEIFWLKKPFSLLFEKRLVRCDSEFGKTLLNKIRKLKFCYHHYFLRKSL